MSTVCASEYGGPSDPTSGTHGYMGDNLTGRMAFAELGMGTALGGLPHGYKLRITYGGRTVIAEKLDIGLGGPGCGGHSRAIDLWWETARQLGFSGLAPVEVSGGSQVQTQTVQNFLPGPIPIPIPENPFESGGGQSGPFGIPNPFQGNPLSFFEAFGKFFSFMTKIAQLLTSKDGWIRIGKVALGLFLLLTGVLGMANIKAVETGKKAVEIATIAK